MFKSLFIVSALNFSLNASHILWLLKIISATHLGRLNICVSIFKRESARACVYCHKIVFTLYFRKIPIFWNQVSIWKSWKLHWAYCENSKIFVYFNQRKRRYFVKRGFSFFTRFGLKNNYMCGCVQRKYSSKIMFNVFTINYVHQKY